MTSISIESQGRHAAKGISTNSYSFKCTKHRLRWITFVKHKEMVYAPGLAFGVEVVRYFRITIER